MKLLGRLAEVRAGHGDFGTVVFGQLSAVAELVIAEVEAVLELDGTHWRNDHSCSTTSR